MQPFDNWSRLALHTAKQRPSLKIERFLNVVGFNIFYWWQFLSVDMCNFILYFRSLKLAHIIFHLVAWFCNLISCYPIQTNLRDWLTLVNIVNYGNMVKVIIKMIKFGKCFILFSKVENMHWMQVMPDHCLRMQYYVQKLLRIFDAKWQWYYVFFCSS